MPNIKLQSSDGEIFDIDVQAACSSNIIKSMLEDLGVKDKEEETIPITTVNAKILRKVVEWAMHHKNDPPPPTAELDEDETKAKRTDDICAWDSEFLKVDKDTLHGLMLAANFLDIKGLLDLTCKHTAHMIKMMSTPEEIRAKFNLENDFSETETDFVKQENEWCLQK